MKFRWTLSILAALACLSACKTADPDGSGGGPRTVDHTDADASVIPDSVIARIKALDVYFEHASVGGRITGGPREYVRSNLGGLDFLAASNARYAYAHEHISDDGTGPLSTAWIDAHDGLVENMRGNPGSPDYSQKIDRFVARLENGDFASHFDVVMFKLCWIDTGGTAQQAFDAAKAAISSLEARYPSVVFVWWTQPIIQQNTSERTANNRRDDYNALVRSYCSANNKYLFDIADIESHDPSGTSLVDGNGNHYLDAAYASDEGHPNETGATRLANAWWVLMARVCGWNG